MYRYSGPCMTEEKVFQKKNFRFSLSSVWSEIFQTKFFTTVSGSVSESELFFQIRIDIRPKLTDSFGFGSPDPQHWQKVLQLQMYRYQPWFFLMRANKLHFITIAGTVPVGITKFTGTGYVKLHHAVAFLPCQTPDLQYNQCAHFPSFLTHRLK
jgi:hypothetical protein